MATSSRITDTAGRQVDLTCAAMNYAADRTYTKSASPSGSYPDTGGTELTVNEIRAGLRKSTLALHITPVFCGSAFKMKGVQPVLDGVLHFLPSPLDVPPNLANGPEDVFERTGDCLRTPRTNLAALARRASCEPERV